MNKKVKVILIVVACLFALLVIKDFALKTIVCAVAGQVTGVKNEMQGFSFGIFRHVISIKGYKMYNPRGFSNNVMLDLPKVTVNYDLGALLKNKLHLIKLDVELHQIVLEKNKDGKLNVDSLKIVKEGQREKKATAKPLPLQIDLFNLQMDKVISKDYGSGKEPVVLAYDLNIKKTYKNITSAQQLAALVISEPMKAAGIRGAQIYAVSALAGAAILPVAIAATFLGRDSAVCDFNVPSDKVYKTALAVLKRSGSVGNENQAGLSISGSVDGADIEVRLNKLSGGKTKATVSARKYLLPKPEIAGGILYQIEEQLK